jgi:hypothetical protein
VTETYASAFRSEATDLRSSAPPSGAPSQISLVVEALHRVLDALLLDPRHQTLIARRQG